MEWHPHFGLFAIPLSMAHCFLQGSVTSKGAPEAAQEGQGHRQCVCAPSHKVGRRRITTRFIM